MNQVIDECVSGTEKDSTGKRLMHVLVNVTEVKVSIILGTSNHSRQQVGANQLFQRDC